MSQGYCASRGIIYDERAKPVLSVFFFFKFLIKKKSSCFLQRVVGVVATRVGRSYLQLEKGYVQLEKIKSKKGLCTIQKVKN